MLIDTVSFRKAKDAVARGAYNKNKKAKTTEDRARE